MPTPIICGSEQFCQFVSLFSSVFSKRLQKYFVIVLLAFTLCEERRTMTGLLRMILDRCSLSGLSRFFGKWKWNETKLADIRVHRFYEQLKVWVETQHQTQLESRPIKAGRPAPTLVTGYLVLDDSTHQKPKGRKMGGLGKHWSNTEKKPVIGHSLFQALLVVGNRLCPLHPKMYCTETVCLKENRPFKSKIQMAIDTISDFVPVSGTKTHVLVDSWYVCQDIWKLCKKLGYDLSGGIRANRKLRQKDAEGKLYWQSLSEYAASLAPNQFEIAIWPSDRGGKKCFVHRLKTKIKKLGVCQILVVKPTPDAPVGEASYFVTTLLDADSQTIITHYANRWEIETFFGDFKELLGSDHYQLMRSRAIERFWALGCCSYQFFEEQRASRNRADLSIGEVRRKISREVHLALVNWIVESSVNGQGPQELMERLSN